MTLIETRKQDSFIYCCRMLNSRALNMAGAFGCTSARLDTVRCMK